MYQRDGVEGVMPRTAGKRRNFDQTAVVIAGSVSSFAHVASANAVTMLRTRCHLPVYLPFLLAKTIFL